MSYAAVLKAITAISIAVMASGCSYIGDGYKVWTNNKSQPGYGQVYQGATFRKFEECEKALPQYKTLAVEGEVFFCAETEETHINWKFWE